MGIAGDLRNNPRLTPPAGLRWWCHRHGALTTAQTAVAGDTDACGRLVFCWHRGQPIPAPEPSSAEAATVTAEWTDAAGGRHRLTWNPELLAQLRAGRP